MEGPARNGSDDPQIGDLAVRRTPLDGSMLCSDVDAVFRADAKLRSVVVSSPNGVYLVARSSFHESLGGPRGYGFSLYGNKPLIELPRQPALHVRSNTPSEWVTQQVLAHGRMAAEEVLVQYPDGYGTVAVSTLLEHLWTLSRGRARKIDSERRRLHALVDHASDFTLVVDRHGVLKWANATDRPSLPFSNVLDGVDTGDIAIAWDMLANAINSPGDVVEGEFRFRFDGEDFNWYAVTFRSLISDPSIRGVVITMRDVETERQLRNDLLHGSATDTLTGLANRASVLTDSDSRVARGERPTLCMLDIDGFKVINDRFGNPTGDAVLQEISRRLRSVSSLEDTVARIDSDEFALLTSDTGDDSELGYRVAEALSVPFEIDEASLRLSASIGVATLSGESMEAVDLLSQAELALFEAKARGKNVVVEFEPALEVAARRREAMRGRLSVALATDAFSLVFQPQMSLTSNQPLRGFEALIRWPDPARGSIPPDEFIPLAEQSGEIVEIGRWVLTGALKQLGEWHRYGAKLTMAVNSSVRELAEADFAPFVAGQLERQRLEPSSLEIEITETALAADDVAVMETLAKLRDLGVGIAVDDYGSGHASIAYLRRYPISTIKVDRELVAMLDDDQRTASALLRSITDVARALGLRSVVEGLETAEQTAFARELGFDLGQGWHCGMPMSAQRAAKLVAVARRDSSTRRTEETAPDLQSFEATLEAFDEVNADRLNKTR